MLTVGIQPTVFYLNKLTIIWHARSPKWSDERPVKGWSRVQRMQAKNQLTRCKSVCFRCKNSSAWKGTGKLLKHFCREIALPKRPGEGEAWEGTQREIESLRRIGWERCRLLFQCRSAGPVNPPQSSANQWGAFNQSLQTICSNPPQLCAKKW